MYFYEAIALGRMAIKPITGMRQLNDPVIGKFGCAIGMADYACGDIVEHIYPWVLGYEYLPCTCGKRDRIPHHTLYITAHLFDHHVYGDQDWTMEQLIDWVKSVDPTIKLDSPEKGITLTEKSGEPDAGQICTDSERSDLVQVMERISSSEIQLQPR
jgi:hypothetical protein